MSMPTKLRAAAAAIAIVAGGLFAVASLSSVLYEQSQRARDRRLFPPVGRAIDLGGRTLDLYCSGPGKPTVVFETGATWPIYQNPNDMLRFGVPRPGYSWVAIERAVAQSSTACWYDRAGSGWSDLGPYPRDSAAQVRDLHTLLSAAGVAPPYILVAESTAVLDARVYTASYPTEVAGLVFIDGIEPAFFLRGRPGGRHGSFPAIVGRGEDFMAHAFDLVGFFRMSKRTNSAAPAPPPDFTPSEWDTVWHLTQSGKTRSALMQDIAAWQESTAEVGAAGPLGARPLIVVSAATNPEVATQYGSSWPEQQAVLAALSTRGRQTVLPQSSGDLIYRTPGAIVQAVRQVVDSASGK